MFLQKTTLSLAMFLMVTGAATNIAAQDKNELKSSVETIEAQTPRTNRIKREVQPISYWVDTPSLRVRDNPGAGSSAAHAATPSSNPVVNSQQILGQFVPLVHGLGTHSGLVRHCDRKSSSVYLTAVFRF